MHSSPNGAAFTRPPSERHDHTMRRRAALAIVASATLALGMVGTVPAFAADPVPLTVAAVQGTEAESIYVGTLATVEGVVIADYRTGGYKGIFIQTADSGGPADATPGASDGIFVYLNNLAPELAIGDLVSVTGIVSENYGQTQISLASLDDIAVTDAGYGVPDATPLPASMVGADREQFEGMLIAPEGTYKLASSHQLFNYGALWLSAGDELNVKNTEQVRPGDEANAIAAANRANRILLDDGWSSQVISNAHPGEQPYFTTDAVVRNGDTVAFADEPYVLQWSFDDWRLQPTIPIDDTNAAEAGFQPTFEANNPRTDAPPAVGGDFTVGSFNVYNYFTTLSSDNSKARGAKTAEQFAIQKSKIVSAINGLDADVVALMEIENSVKLGEGIDTALADLVDGLNAAAGAGTWSFVLTPTALDDAAITDYITNAIIYKTGVVTPVGDSKTTVDETVWDIAREPIAQAFDLDGKIVTVVANHFKSKSPPSGNKDPDPADGQGFFTAERTEQAAALVAFTDQLAMEAGSDDMLLIGDFNAYAFEDPIDVFTQAGWTDLVRTQAPGQYTYTYDGELGSLDHVIASPSLADYITGTGVWNINSPEWSDRGYANGATEAGTPYRSSDHDPIVVGVSAELAPIDINVVTINDFHGRIEADGAAAGAAVLAGAVAEVRANNPNTIFAAAGDLIGASTFTSFIQDDNPTIDALNAAGLEVSAAGNHEFDQGWADLRDRVIPRAAWEYLSSNVFLKGTDTTAMAPSWVQELDGVKVGFIGAVTEDVDSLVSATGIADVDIRDIAESVNAASAALTDGDLANGEADVIILLVHEGAATVDISSITPESPLGRIVDGVNDKVDAIVSAHTHLAYNHVIDGRPVISAGKYGENYGLMDIKVDAMTKELLSISNTIMPLTENKQPLYPAVPEVQAIVDDAKAEADVLGSKKVGEITADFNRALQSDGSTENRGGESTIGNFVADVQLWAAPGADIALMNPGGIRTNLSYASTGPEDPNGNVTFREAANVQPFANTLVTFELTGAQLKSALEEQWQVGQARPFLKLGVSEGLKYSYDPSGAQGSRVSMITLNGEEIDPAASYKIVANSFLAAGGDNFATLGAGTNRADTGKVDLQSMVDWFAAKTTANPDYAQRAVGAILSAPAAGASYEAGEAVTLDLSSLAFSAGEPAAENVTVSLGGEELASAPIDSTMTLDAYDEVGTATLEFTVPSGVFGEQSLTVLVPSTGTTLEIPITLMAAPATDATISVDPGSVAAGGTITVKGAKFEPGDAVTIELRSTPVVLGTATAGADGTFSAKFVIPVKTAVGAHTIVAVQPNGAESSAALTVTAAAGAPGGPGDNIANTGFEGGTFALAALLVLLLGAGLTVVSRRRQYAE